MLVPWLLSILSARTAGAAGLQGVVQAHPGISWDGNCLLRVRCWEAETVEETVSKVNER